MQMAASLRAKGVSTDLIMEDGKKSKWWVLTWSTPMFSRALIFAVLEMKSVACCLWCARAARDLSHPPLETLKTL
jgi:hypothetical protein